MKLQLNKKWFEKHIQPNEEYEVGVGVPTASGQSVEKPLVQEQQKSNDVVDSVGESKEATTSRR